MVLKQQKIEVTDRVVGRLKDGILELYLEDEKIGEMMIPSGAEIQFQHHYEGTVDSIFQHVTTVSGPDAKYTDCDDGGWC